MVKDDIHLIRGFTFTRYSGARKMKWIEKIDMGDILEPQEAIIAESIFWKEKRIIVKSKNIFVKIYTKKASIVKSLTYLNICVTIYLL